MGSYLSAFLEAVEGPRAVRHDLRTFSCSIDPPDEQLGANLRAAERACELLQGVAPRVELERYEYLHGEALIDIAANCHNPGFMCKPVLEKCRPPTHRV